MVGADGAPTVCACSRRLYPPRCVLQAPIPPTVRAPGAHCDEHNIVLVTFVNSNRANYAYTWAWHVKRLGLTNYMVGAMDGEALVKLAARNITAFDMVVHPPPHSSLSPSS